MIKNEATVKINDSANMTIETNNITIITNNPFRDAFCSPRQMDGWASVNGSETAERKGRMVPANPWGKVSIIK